MSATGTPAVTAARRAGIEFTLHDLGPEGSAAGEQGYGPVAAAVLGVDPGRVLKTLVAEVDGRLGIGIVPVDRQLDLKALAAALGAKRAVLADPVAAQRATGYVVGGISPLGGRRPLPTVVHATALDHPTVHVSAGRRGLELELEPTDLVRLTRAVVASIAR